MADAQGDCKCRPPVPPSHHLLFLPAQTSTVSACQRQTNVVRLAPSKLTLIGSTESNDAVNISLVTPSDGGIKTLHSFNPKMTYSIFGDEETIFGYQGLKINLRYNACDMRPGLQITYTKKFKTVGETSPTDLKEVLEPYLPKGEHYRIPSISHRC
jgi:hypothetical protein